LEPGALLRPEDWDRMSWYQRKHYVAQVRAARKAAKQEAVRIGLRRCNLCGAWRWDECTTPHEQYGKGAL